MKFKVGDIVVVNGGGGDWDSPEGWTDYCEIQIYTAYTMLGEVIEVPEEPEFLTDEDGVPYTEEELEEDVLYTVRFGEDTHRVFFQTESEVSSDAITLVDKATLKFIISDNIHDFQTVLPKTFAKAKAQAGL